jgi:hypothetical protein
VKFGRKKDTDSASDDVETTDEEMEPTPGPYDADDLPDDGVERVDLGSLLIQPEQGRELRLQVDEATGDVHSVMLTGQDGAIELRAFAAPRNGDLWSEVRPQIVADMAQRGGTATEREGRFGTEVVCEVQVKRPDGGTAVQASRIVGINGPRWLLRATFLGRPVEPDRAEDWEDSVTKVAVRRGAQALPVGEPLPVILPEQARRVSPTQE